MLSASQNIIYALIDPRTRLVRYVGSSRRGIQRAKAHAFPSNQSRKTHTACWIRSLASLGLTYEITILDYLPSPDCVSENECWWIAYGRALGWDLTNHTDGGEGCLGLIFSEESREKMRKALTGYKHTAQARANMSAGQKRAGRRMSAENKEKLRQSRLGKPRPDLAARQRAKKGLPGRPQTDAERLKRSRTMTEWHARRKEGTLP